MSPLTHTHVSASTAPLALSSGKFKGVYTEQSPATSTVGGLSGRFSHFYDDVPGFEIDVGAADIVISANFKSVFYSFVPLNDILFSMVRRRAEGNGGAGGVVSSSSPTFTFGAGPLGLTLVNADEGELGDPSISPVVVEEVAKGGQGEALEVQVGDHVFSVEESRVFLNVPELVLLMKAQSRPMTVTFARRVCSRGSWTLGSGMGGPGGMDSMQGANGTAGRGGPSSSSSSPSSSLPLASAVVQQYSFPTACAYPSRRSSVEEMRYPPPFPELRSLNNPY